MRPVLLAAVLLAAPALAQVPAQIPTTLTVSAEGKVSRAPDVADLSAGVVTQAATATAAMSDNAQRMSAVVAALRKAGVADRDIQTAGLNLNPQYRYVENQPPQLVGYQAANTVSVRVRDLKNMGRAIDALVASGANQVNGPSFRLDKPEGALDEARTDAVKTARARAALYASAAGMKVRRIVSINENGGYAPPPYPMPMMRAAAAPMAEKADTPVAPGEVEQSVSVTVTFELE